MIRQLEVFRMVMIAGTTSSAASMLGISQPAVSRIIMRFEEQLGLTLFDRTGGRLSPTAEAQILYERVQRIFVSVERIAELAAELRAASVGRLHVAVMPTLARSLMPPVLKRFGDLYPEVDLTIDIQNSARIGEWASSQLIDFGVAELPLDLKGVEVEQFANAPYQLIVPAGHPLAGREAAGPLDTKGYPFIALTSESSSRHHLDRLFSQASVELRPHITTSRNGMIADLVAQGLGIGVVDPFTAVAQRERGIMALRFEPVLDFSIGVLYPTRRPLSRVAREFLSVLRRHRDQMLSDCPASPA